MQLDRKPRVLRGGEHAGDLVAGEGDRLAKTVDRVDQAFARQRRDHHVGDIGDIGVAFVRVFGRQRVRAEKRRADRDVAFCGELARDAQRFALGGKVEPVAGFDFHRSDALGDQGVQAPERRGHEFVLARGAGRAHGGENAAA